MRTAPSLRRRLLWVLLLSLGVAWSGAAILTYFDAHRAVDALLDAHLRQSSKLLVAQAELDLDDLKLDDEVGGYGTEVAFQVRRADGSVLARSTNAPLEPLAPGIRGFSETRNGERRWRVYTTADEDGTIVHFAEDHATRERIARQMALRAMTPLLAALPLLGLVIWWVVGRSLRPLDRLGEEVARRDADDLAPVAAGPLPAELRPLASRLDELFLRIRASLDAERRFTSHAAHELRTPVAALRAQAEVAAGARDPAVREAALRHCIEACDRMARLVSQLLVLARADEMAALAGARPCRLELVAQGLLAEMAPQAVAQGVTVALEADGKFELNGDLSLLEALVRNLVDNAVRHANSHVRVSLRSQPGAIELQVDDDGAGVPADELPQLGRRFYRGHGARGPGSGLGLSIVARIAELHHAQVRYENPVANSGLRVIVRFPA